jgi:signal transduction histidine kinase
MHERLSSVLPSLHRAIGLTGETDPSLRFLRHVEEGLDRTFHLLARLAAFSGESPLIVETVSVADCAAEAVRRLEAERPAGVSLTASIPRELPPIAADRVQLTAALMEVTRNALEAAPEGTGVGLELVVEDDGITITVHDEGAGMTAEVLEQAIYPFFSTRHPSRHAGLGLSTVQGCVDRHGGTLAISSGPGEGTRVRMWFPVSLRSPTL